MAAGCGGVRGARPRVLPCGPSGTRRGDIGKHSEISARQARLAPAPGHGRNLGPGLAQADATRFFPLGLDGALCDARASNKVVSTRGPPTSTHLLLFHMADTSFQADRMQIRTCCTHARHLALFCDAGRGACAHEPRCCAAGTRGRTQCFAMLVVSFTPPPPSFPPTRRTECVLDAQPAQGLRQTGWARRGGLGAAWSPCSRRGRPSAAQARAA